MPTPTLPHRFSLILALFAFAFAFAFATPALAATKLVLIGDSTVKNGQGQGDGGLWGWGQVLQSHFDDDQLVVENRALGGRSSRTYLTEGLWARSLDALRPGDYVLIQFGHNDGGELFMGDRPRASLKGNGEETQEGVVELTGKTETVHSYGWYLRRYITDAKAKGATPIVLSPVPRNIWRDGRVVRASNDYGKWAREAAEQAGAPFVDLNEIVAQRYEEVGQASVPRGTFTDADHTHTTRQGAEINAACVVEGLRGLPEIGLTKFLKESAK
jgi:lysophospholipase L1-like esterase